jgi:glycosyltransferase involved in cell wall biosynthesis
MWRVYRNKRISVIVPAYNEERLLPEVIHTMPDFVDTIYVIDDGSTDETPEIARSFNDSRMQHISHDQNRGVGAAIVSGYRRVLEDGTPTLL